MSSRGNLIVISGPSGSGKTSLARRALENLPGLKFSVSHTTRPARRGETDGVDYFFVSEEEFLKMVEEDAFLEHAIVYGRRYGTGRAFVEAELAAGNDVLLDIDVQGALQVKKAHPDAVTVFVLPPSLEELRTRLEDRGLDDESVIERRLEIARREIAFFPEYRYLIVNEDFDRSLQEIQAVILAARCELHAREAAAKAIVRTFRR